ncbi:hypothetical protein A3H89_04510 [Candidatus Amesbacteria bacterium RIFCSPLOWO2_02_FULL_48_11]|uniref:Uncharacterized protein n=2 Tax=Candidatus Amesiibacteriota TaxID=1752730 RepID=A0A1F4Z713_9BACT|nr:MAG: hypothetical protein A2V48_01325 [Candidatus Amesbacteria bacterium RBG_19FT_COMBO_48_16]OGC97256.1 MAG: hypothetical protein A3C34_04425 [Candidatus Amesbacteria bacterium RIFCSPHIGHO2_02_FULL_48_21]OGC99199.1 MAG: hypothetical protein A2702_01535 [Candidatus Amesbacteria bacterium RIFCSPHIGHO2_01_FULL_48_75]OGC99271.1 MAG: hypothetical protein A2W16_02635 [Candidatus Amesbacteria bacterium RBG_16_48_31]OGD02152.1 MAG: hypothetical protein A3E17_03515 [Candidatus Amesbacteria bacterium
MTIHPESFGRFGHFIPLSGLNESERRQLGAYWTLSHHLTIQTGPPTTEQAHQLEEFRSAATDILNTAKNQSH